jgi:hypothetical protein
MFTDYKQLVKTWCDTLMIHQVKGTMMLEYEGGIMCPACTGIHGRCADAIYPLTYLADKTGNIQYLNSAKMLFQWSERNVIKADGSYVNDSNNDWKGITVFAAISLGETLYYHGNILDNNTKQMWNERFKIASEFMYNYIDGLIDNTNINYTIAAAAALAIADRNLNVPKYKTKAYNLAHLALNFIDSDGLIFGEGHPPTSTTPKGCRAVDLAYNTEESLANLLTYAMIENDTAVYNEVIRAMQTHLNFMMPDGSWDDSWGSRNAKWCYWGSRSSDGCQNAYGILANQYPAFGEAAYRNAVLMEKCTVNGLLAGGPMYASAKEPACIHHTFSHAKSIVTMLNHGVNAGNGHALPTDSAQGIRFYNSIHVRQVAKGPWRATISDYDYDYGVVEGNPTGGALTLLLHEVAGPILAATMTTYKLTEQTNMQLPFQQPPTCQTPRIEYVQNNVYYRSINDKKAVVNHTQDDKSIIVIAKGTLRDGAQNGTIDYIKQHTFTDSNVNIRVRTDAQNAVYRLPVISKNIDLVKVQPTMVEITTDKAKITVTCIAGLTVEPIPKPVTNPYFDNGKPKTLSRTFNPVAGFEALPILFNLKPGEGIEIIITVTKI